MAQVTVNGPHYGTNYTTTTVQVGSTEFSVTTTEHGNFYTTKVVVVAPGKPPYYNATLAPVGNCYGGLQAIVAHTKAVQACTALGGQ